MKFVAKLIAYFKKTEDKLELTEWYPPDVKPVWEGVYQVKSVLASMGHFYALWNGEEWVFEDIQDCPLKKQDREWRGVL